MSIEVLQFYKPFLDWLVAHPQWVVGVAALVLLIRFWDWLLDWDGGAYWPFPASLLPVAIALVPNFMDIKARPDRYGFILGGLLGTFAVLQVYGQAREKRYRKLADARINRIGVGVDCIGLAVNSIAAATAERLEEEEDAQDPQFSVESFGGGVAEGDPLTSYDPSERATEIVERILRQLSADLPDDDTPDE